MSHRSMRPTFTTMAARCSACVAVSALSGAETSAAQGGEVGPEVGAAGAVVVEAAADGAGGGHGPHHPVHLGRRHLVGDPSDRVHGGRRVVEVVAQAVAVVGGVAVAVVPARVLGPTCPVGHREQEVVVGGDAGPWEPGPVARVDDLHARGWEDDGADGATGESGPELIAGV